MADAGGADGAAAARPGAAGTQDKAPRRLRVGRVLLGVALVGLLGFHLVLPAPVELEYALQDAENTRPPRIAKVAARGPAEARYDAANGTTVMVFQCAHQSCPVAVRVRGHHDAVGAGTVILDLPGWKRPLGFEPLDPPMRVNDRQQETEVDRVVDATFERETPAVPAAAVGALLAMAGAGFALATRRPVAAGPLALAALAGEGPGLVVAAGGGLLLFLGVPFVLLPLALVAAAFLRAGRRRPRLATVGWGLVLFLAALLGSALLLMPYYTQPPML